MWWGEVLVVGLLFSGRGRLLLCKCGIVCGIWRCCVLDLDVWRCRIVFLLCMIVCWWVLVLWLLCLLLLGCLCRGWCFSLVGCIVWYRVSVVFLVRRFGMWFWVLCWFRLWWVGLCFLGMVVCLLWVVCRCWWLVKRCLSDWGGGIVLELLGFSWSGDRWLKCWIVVVRLLWRWWNWFWCLGC